MKTTAAVLLECLELAKIFTSELKFDGGYIGHLYTISLYATILELIDETVHLVRDGPKTGIPILTRSILEAYVDLKNATEDKTYISVIEFEWIKSWRKLMEAAESGNQYVSRLAGDPNFQSNIEGYQKRLDELKRDGIKPLKIFEKFKKAGLTEEYEAIYGILCPHSHGGFQALIDRHIDINVKGGNPKVKAFQDRQISEFEIYLGTTCELLAKATEQINQYLLGEENSRVTAIREIIDAQKCAITSARSGHVGSC